MFDWLPFSEEFWIWLGVASAVMFVATLVAVPLLVVRIRPDYFIHTEPPARSWLGQHQAARITLLVLKNLLGVVLILAGIAMLVLPGQGILTILFGVMLLNFPGKREFELWLVRRNGVLKAVNWMRLKANYPPLRLAEDDESGKAEEKAPSE